MRWTPLFILVLLMCGCSGKSKESLDGTGASAADSADAVSPERVKPRGRPLNVEIPLGLPPLPVNDSTLVTEDMAALGRRLFYEVNISGDSVLSCASCHISDRRFSDGRPVSAGFSSAAGERNTPTLLNAAYYRDLNWDGAATASAIAPNLGALEGQIHFPFEDPTQMASSTAALEKKLNISDNYHLAFQKTFGRAVDVKFVLAARVFGAFERTLLSGNSPFDRYLFRKEENAISASAARGWMLFKDAKRGNCVACHTVGEKWALFTDGKYHNLGVGVDAQGDGRDLGRFRITQRNSDRGAFRTPSLRNVAETAPYMHNGSLRTLRAVIEFYSDGGNANPYRDPLLKPLNYTDKEIDDLIAFLESLTGDMPANGGRPSREESEAPPDKP